MTYGIRISLVAILLVMGGQMAHAQVSKHQLILSICKGMNSSDYTVHDTYPSSDGGMCYKFTCDASTSSNGVSASTANVLEKCISKSEYDEIQARIEAEVIGDITAGGDWELDMNGVKWPRGCIKANGKVRRRCRNMSVDGGVHVNGGVTGTTIQGNVVTDASGRVICTYEYHPDECGVSVHADASIDCTNCAGGKRFSTGFEILMGMSSLAGNVLPHLAAYGIHRNYANAMVDINGYWADAQSVGFEQCALMQQTYINQSYAYISSNELPDRDVIPPQCQGYHIGAFGGGTNMMGAGGFGMGFGNPWMQAGYSPGFMGGMMGPYGGYNPYAGPGFNIGMQGYPGMGGGYGGYGGWWRIRWLWWFPWWRIRWLWWFPWWRLRRIPWSWWRHQYRRRIWWRLRWWIPRCWRIRWLRRISWYWWRH
jgi:hypothetical protein